MKRKVLRWESYQPPRVWVAHLECGHRENPSWDDVRLLDADKERIDAAGGVECLECRRTQERIEQLENELAKLKQR